MFCLTEFAFLFCFCFCVFLALVFGSVSLSPEQPAEVQYVREIPFLRVPFEDLSSFPKAAGMRQRWLWETAMVKACGTRINYNCQGAI